MVRIRSVPEDFRVDEIPLYAPSGDGAHTFVRIEKRLITTEDAARLLARAAGVKPRDVGYAGRKDRVAVATQWLSVPDLDPNRALDLRHEGLRVLECARHEHKIRVGHLRGNRFVLVVRDVTSQERERGERELERILARGLPNRFGPQRFGRDGNNPEAARRMLREGRVVGDRRRARFLLSALQSAVFNDVLEARADSFDQIEPGDVAMVRESGGSFVVDDAIAEGPRAATFEISPTGPIFGSKMLAPRCRPAQIESAARERQGVPEDADLRLPRGLRARGARRALRVRVEKVAWERDGDAIELRFELPSGSYASVLIEELFGDDSADDSGRPPGVC